MRERDIELKNVVDEERKKSLTKRSVIDGNRNFVKKIIDGFYKIYSTQTASNVLSTVLMYKLNSVSFDNFDVG